MAYMNFGAGGTAMSAATAAPRATPRATLSALEWSVVALAERDHPATLRTPGRLSVALGTLFGGRGNPRLADPRLEALRQMAVLSWRYGYVVPSTAIGEFLRVGFTADQYELLVDSIGAARAKRRARPAR